MSYAVIGAAIEVHRTLGPGLLESAYEKCLARELALRGISFERQKRVPLRYRGLELDCGFRLDLYVENQLVVEVKAVKHVTDVHRAQLVTYMKLTNSQRALLLNFHEVRMRDGVQRFYLRDRSFPSS